MAANGISTLETKELRQVAKLAIAEAKRQGKTVAANGTITGAVDSTKPYYRARNVYDLDRLPTQYSGNTVVDNANSEGLLRARPWTAYNITPTANIINEGSTLTVNIASLEILDGTTVYWSVSNSGDFGTALGTFVVNNDSGSFTVTPTADLSTEGTETFNITLRRGSSSGTVVATFSSVSINDTSLTPSGDAAGLYRTTYTGYFADNPAFFATATVSSAAVNLSPIGDGDPGFEPFSVQLLGYFKPTTTETHTFFLTSDDASFMWLGSTAVTGFTTANAFINNGGVHGSEEVSASIALTAGVYYPIRIQMGDQSGGDVLELNYSTPTIVKTTTVTGKIFYNSATNGF